MANSKYAYVRDFELPDPLLPGTFMLFRLDGHSFHRFSEKHEFKKPNDVRALQVMDHAAKDVMTEYPDIVLAFGESDEFSFLLRKSTSLYNRRQSKIVSTLTSLFTSSYVFHWPEYFPDFPLQYPPSFDGRIVLYPTEKHIRDYFAWRQADTHINNLYNTTFWALIQQGGKTTTEAHKELSGTFSKDKNEILFSRFGINYSQLDARFRKGSILYREEIFSEGDDSDQKDFKTSIREEAPAAADGSNSSRINVMDNADAADVYVVEEDTTRSKTPTPMTIISENLPTDRSGDTRDSGETEAREGVAEESTKQTTPTIPITRSKALPAETNGETWNGSQTDTKSKSTPKAKKKPRQKLTRIETVHCDIIKDEFWNARPGILGE